MAEEPKKIANASTETEIIAAYGGPAPGANKFVISIGSPGVRIAFLETNVQLPDRAFFRSGVTLHPSEAIQLHKVLADTLKDIEKQIIAAKVNEVKKDDDDG